MKIFGQLEYAQMELINGDAADKPNGRFWYDTSKHFAKIISNGDVKPLGIGNVFRGDFTGTSLTQNTDYGIQSHLYAGVSAQEFAAGGFGTIANYVDGTRITIIGSSDTNTLTIPSNHAQVIMNGDIELGYGQAITFEYVEDLSKMIEISRSK